MTNFDRYKEHKHKWFEESLCELASLFVLHKLAAVWELRPPAEIIDAVTYAPNFKTYAEDTAAKFPRICPGDPRKWMSENIKVLESNPYDRSRNGAVAVSLLNWFLEDPSLWRDCTCLNHWDPSANVTFSDYLHSWNVCLCERNFGARAPNLVSKLLYG